MIYTFTCSTEGCENNINPVNLCDPTNPVLCSLCHLLTDAVETDEPCPTPKLEALPEPAPKATKK